VESKNPRGRENPMIPGNRLSPSSQERKKEETGGKRRQPICPIRCVSGAGRGRGFHRPENTHLVDIFSGTMRDVLNPARVTSRKKTIKRKPEGGVPGRKRGDITRILFGGQEGRILKDQKRNHQLENMGVAGEGSSLQKVQTPLRRPEKRE